jgi:hypothetical protein
MYMRKNLFRKSSCLSALEREFGRSIEAMIYFDLSMGKK